MFDLNNHLSRRERFSDPRLRRIWDRACLESEIQLARTKLRLAEQKLATHDLKMEVAHG